MTNRLKVIVLWTIFLFGMVFHSLLAVAPLFWGRSITMSEELIAKNPYESSIWMMLLFFLLPMIVIVMTLFIEIKWYKISNFVLSILFTLMNIFHIIGHVCESPVDSRQVVLLTFVLVSGIFLNITSFKWMRE